MEQNENEKILNILHKAYNEIQALGKDLLNGSDEYKVHHDMLETMQLLIDAATNSLNK